MHFVQLEALPLNANGKVDRRALPEPSVATLATSYADDSSQSEAEGQMVAIWREVLGRPDVGPTDDFFILGGHSLKATKLASLIQKKMGVEVSLTAAFKHSTPRDLTRHLLKTARFGVEVADEPLVRMTRNNSGRSLFAFPPGSGDALSFAQLANYLDSFELYGFNFFDAESRLEDYAEMVLQVDSDGPYLLMGYSGGGNLAYHVARVLEARGKRVARVVMFDSARNLAQVEYDRDLARQLARDYMAADEFRPYVENAILREKIIRRVQSYYAFFSHLLDEHIIDARIDLITSEGSAYETRDDSGRLLVSKLRWSEVSSGGFERYTGHGNHNNMLYKPYVEPNARLLTKLLSQIT
jgi:thioesterase domain-containing protein